LRYITIFRYIDTVIGCIDIILRLSVLRYIDILVYCPSSSKRTQHRHKNPVTSLPHPFPHTTTDNAPSCPLTHFLPIDYNRFFVSTQVMSGNEAWERRWLNA